MLFRSAATMGGIELAGQAGEQVGIPRAATGAAVLGAAPALGKGAARAVLGTPTQTREKYARALENLGFEISPAQVRATEPAAARGAAFKSDKNQELANKLVSASTGKEAKEISPEFVRDRLSDLGKQFDKLYKGNNFIIDQPAVDAIQSIAAEEAQLQIGRAHV